MQVIGKLVKKLDRETGVSKSGKSWEKQSIIIEQNGKDFNKEVVISFFGDKVRSLRNINEGSEVNVAVNLSSREYNGKYYHNIDGWFISNIGEETVGNNDNSDLPF